MMQTERLKLRHFRREDEADYIRLNTNTKVMHYILGRPHTIKESQERFQRTLAMTSPHQNLGVFGLYLKEEYTFVGLAKLEWKGNETAELGYLLFPAFWQKGYGTEIAQFLVQEGKKILQVQKIIAYINPSNKGSQKILLNCGFSFVKEKINNDIPDALYELNLETSL